jgi:hypothetical protein
MPIQAFNIHITESKLILLIKSIAVNGAELGNSGQNLERHLWIKLYVTNILNLFYEVP